MTGADRGRVLVRGRVATSLLFLLFGVALGTWTARIPAVKDRLHLSDGQLSLALLAFAAGAIIGMALLGRAVDRVGSTAVMVPAAAGECVLLVPPAFMPGLPALAAALLAFGMVHGTLNVAMNASAVEVQRAWKRPIMSSFHAVYSIGGLIGAATGGLFARAGVSAGLTFIWVGAVLVLLAVWAAWWAPPPGLAPAGGTGPAGGSAPAGGSGPAGGSAPAGGSGPAAPGRPLPSRSYALLLLGVLALCALVGEGAAADWSAVYLHDTLGSTAGFAASGYAAFSVMMAAGRLAGDRLTVRYGPVNLVRASGVLAGLGLGAALLIATPLAGVLGFGCLGGGLSFIAPQVYSAAGNRDPARAGRSLSTVVSIGYAGFVAGPVLIGSVSTAVGLRAALGIPAALALAVAAGAPILRAA
jgi:predicted MFS family arabinose efflux permease